MNDWIKKEMQALRDYMGKPNFGKEQEYGAFVYEDKDEGLKITVTCIAHLYGLNGKDDGFI